MPTAVLVNPHRFAQIGPSTFGRTTPGNGNYDSTNVNFRFGSKYAITGSWSVRKLVAYMDGSGPGAGSQVFKGLIYAGDGTNTAGVLLATSTEVAITDGQALGWVEFPFPSAIDLSAGTYWLQLHLGAVSNGSRVSWDTTGSNGFYAADTYSDGPATPGGAMSLNSGTYAIYASTAPAGPTGGPYSHIGSDALSLATASSESHTSVATFGKETVGSVTNVEGDGYRAGSKFATSAGLTVARLVAYLDGQGTGTGNEVVRGVIYAGDGTGTAGALVATSGEVTVTDGQAGGWVGFPFTTPPALAAGTYWLMIHAGPASSTIRTYKDSTANGSGWIADTYSDGAASSGGALNMQTGVISIYATSQASSGGGGGGSGLAVTFSNATPVLWSNSATVNWS